MNNNDFKFGVPTCRPSELPWAAKMSISGVRNTPMQASVNQIWVCKNIAQCTFTIGTRKAQGTSSISQAKVTHQTSTSERGTRHPHNLNIRNWEGTRQVASTRDLVQTHLCSRLELRSTRPHSRPKLQLRPGLHLRLERGACSKLHGECRDWMTSERMQPHQS